MGGWARFWAIDLHVHTPGSSDAKDEDYGSPETIVQAAIDAGLDAIAITDHNTTSWCDQIAAAASRTSLTVLPGVEISTTEGHLVAIWEVGTPVETIRDLLVSLDIKSADHGKLDIAAKKNLAEAARKVEEYGGIAIPAHIDRPRGMLGIEVKDHLIDTMLEPAISAVEIVKRETEADEVEPRVKEKRVLACVRGSDTFDKTLSRHALSGIGSRRTWIKASRPDLIGLKHALEDPLLRLRLDPPPTADYPVIQSISFQHGFMDGQTIELSPDLNCLLGGTGTGKSLILEAIRYAADQQVDARRFPAIAEEVHERLKAALGETGVVILRVKVDNESYRIERVYGSDGSSRAVVMQLVGKEWATVDVDPRELIEIDAFSQGEILEYAREPVGRMSLIDSMLDLSKLETDMRSLVLRLKENGRKLIAARGRIDGLKATAGRAVEIDEQVRQISAFFDKTVVKAQASWKTEHTRLSGAHRVTDNLTAPSLTISKQLLEPLLPKNADLFTEASTIMDNLASKVSNAIQSIEDAKSEAVAGLSAIETKWAGRFAEFKRTLDEELDKVRPGESVSALRIRLEELQARSLEAHGAKSVLDDEAVPALEALGSEREQRLEELRQLRHQRRDLRRERVQDLNKQMANQVKIDVPNEGDFAEFRATLDVIKVGSQAKAPVLDAIGRHVSPLRFARDLWKGDVADLVNEDQGIDATSVARLLSNIADKNLWAELLDAQLIERPDVLTVKFKKPGEATYTPIENLAHGQKCTAILIILLADGDSPVLVDQPEDALHAPWIEDYLVDRLRSLRGSRQYLFPTRSPGIVVSGDAEQIITLDATAGKSEVQASGSLERHDLNKLALHHLEGGPIPFSRRTRKLAVSTEHPA